MFQSYERWIQMNLMGELNYFLRLQIKQNREGIFINQAKYTRDLLKDLRWTIQNRWVHQWVHQPKWKMARKVKTLYTQGIKVWLDLFFTSLWVDLLSCLMCACVQDFSLALRSFISLWLKGYFVTLLAHKILVCFIQRVLNSIYKDTWMRIMLVVKLIEKALVMRVSFLAHSIVMVL